MEVTPTDAAAASTLSCCPTVLAAVSSTLRSLSYLLIPTIVTGGGGASPVPGTGPSPKRSQNDV